MRAILWIVLMIGWPVLLAMIGMWIGKPSDPVTGRLDFDAFYFAYWLPTSIWLDLGGWIIITYLCIGKKSAAALVLIYFVVYISPLQMYAFTSQRDCGPIPDWKCRWTCKSTAELIDLGIGHPYVSSAFWWDNPDVIKAGGLC